MASISRRKKSRFWTACYTAQDGRQLKRSTKTTDKRQALQLALEYEQAEKKLASGVATCLQMRKVISDISERVTGETLIAPSVEDYLNDWLKGIKTRNRAATIQRYDKTVRLFLEGLNGKAKQPVTAVTPSDIEIFLNRRLESGVAPQTAIIDLKTLNTAFRRADAYGIIVKNPVAAVRPPKTDRSEREVFTHEEVQKILEATPSVEWQTLILLGYFIGARLSDCVNMKWENIYPEENVIIYRQQKTGKKVIVPMHLQVLRHVKGILPSGTEGFLCPKLAGKGTGGKHGLSEGFIRIVIKAGLDPMVVEGKGVRRFTRRSFHSLRHSFNSILANVGVSQEVRMKLTGHQSKPMNERYTHLQMETLKNAMDAVPLFEQKNESSK
jgi:integrase